MTTRSTQSRSIHDLTAAVAAAAHGTGWRVCARCGELSLPPGGPPAQCVSCPIPFSLTLSTKGTTDGTDRQHEPARRRPRG